jgi:hypothetical protein
MTTSRHVKGRIKKTPEILALADAINLALDEVGYQNRVRMAADVLAILEEKGWKLCDRVP